MALQFYFDYLKHKFTSNSRHGTHSPFVYQLVDKVIYDFKPKKVYEPIEAQRKVLLQNTQEILITDLGAGSLLNNNKRKTVQTIAKNALKNPALAQLLFRIAEHFQPKNLIELGTCLGITSAYFAQACPEATVYTIEGCPETAKVAQQNFEQLNLTNIDSLIGNFDAIFPDLLQKLNTVDMVYIDGNHTQDATIRYFEQCLPKIHEGTVLIFDDIYWSEGMKEAWLYIQNHHQVTVTLDLFWIGLVFFKTDQAKEHFKIKF